MEPKTWVKRDESGKAVAAIVYLPERRGGQIHADWDENLSEGDWEILPSGDTRLSVLHDAGHYTEDTIRFFFENPEDLLYCIKWYWAMPLECTFRHAVMREFLAIR